MVPLLPVFGFVFQTFIGRKLPKPVVSFVSCGVVFASCLLSWMLFLKVRETHEAVVANLGHWINIPGLKNGWLSVVADHKLIVDELTAVMILVVTNIGFLIHVYSTGYMADEKRYARYFAYLNLFTGFMLILVMASNLLLMFVGWEGVGLCSYLLIGFWFEKSENAAAGMKAFVVNRIGDLAFTVGALMLFVTIGRATGIWTVDFQELQKAIADHPGILEGVTFWIPFLLFIGATGKSAQMPLYVWLPDAMAGPTPVSALIHAATMVTAGVYMIARMNFVYVLSPGAMAVVTGVGAVTAIFAGSIGVAQNDIKKVLAYSTVSQLGFMFMGVGVGAFAAGIFHLFTHAFFKACLFLGSGSVIHGMGGEQDIRKMGGLKAKMPWTFWTFVIASAALSGVPPLAGFFSKDEILWKAFSTHAFEHTGLGMWFGKLIWLTGATAAACTAFYMTRLVIKTFLDRPKWGTATSFSGAGLPDWMDEKEKKEPKKEPPKKGTGPDGMPAWMEDDAVGGGLPADESMLDFGNVKKKPSSAEPSAGKPKKEEPAPPPPPSHDDESHPAIPLSDLQDESMLDLGRVGPKAHAHEDHGHAQDLPQDESMLDLGRVKGGHDAHAPAAHDAGHGDDAGHGHGGHGHGDPHESPWSMLIALVLLAFCSIWVGLLNRPPALGGGEAFTTWLSPVVEHGAAAEHAEKPGSHEAAAEGHHVQPLEYLLMLVSIAAAFGGIGFAWYVYGKRSGVPAQEFAEKHKELYELVRDKYRVDELYEATVIKPLLNLNEGTCRFDNEVVDGAVNGAATVGKAVAKATGLVDNEVVDAAVNGAALATQMVARKVRRAQTGNIKDYLTFALVGGLFVIALFCLWLTRENLWAKINELFGSNR
ncbi:MAG: NADH-quinone oxidoreductase subunit L [Planctomycetes bacterium]|nr:NADH-quinone oxidoreductase subunit L [Planctomycetota bacterium]